MHIHKHICTQPSIYAQMDICMNLIALQSYPLNKFEQTTPNRHQMNTPGKRKSSSRTGSAI